MPRQKNPMGRPVKHELPQSLGYDAGQIWPEQSGQSTSAGTKWEVEANLTPCRSRWGVCSGRTSLGGSGSLLALRCGRKFGNCGDH